MSFNTGNPECQAGKHGNCNGQELDPDIDEFTDCSCVCHDKAPEVAQEFTRP